MEADEPFWKPGRSLAEAWQNLAEPGRKLWIAEKSSRRLDRLILFLSRFIESEKLQISNQHAKTQRGIRKAPHEAGGEHRPGPAMPLYDIFLLLNRLSHDSSYCFCFLSS